MTDRIRVFVVDDHALFRSGVKAEIGDAVEIVGDVGSVDDAIVAIRAAKPDVVLLDVHLPNGGGRAILEGLADDLPDTKCLALSVSDAADDVIGVIRAGARGYVTKTITREELLARAFGPAYDGLDRTVDVHITNLRKKLEPGREPKYVLTVHGVGYRLAKGDDL